MERFEVFFGNIISCTLQNSFILKPVVSLLHSYIQSELTSVSMLDGSVLSVLAEIFY